MSPTTVLEEGDFIITMSMTIAHHKVVKIALNVSGRNEPLFDGNMKLTNMLQHRFTRIYNCLLYTSDAADE